MGEKSAKIQKQKKKDSKKKSINSKEKSDEIVENDVLNENPPLDEVALGDLKHQVDFLETFAKTLQKSFDMMAANVSKMNKTMEYLTQTVEKNKKLMNSTLKAIKKNAPEVAESLNKSKNRKKGKKSIDEHGREEINEQNFLQALKNTLSLLKEENPDKEYIKIKILKRKFNENYGLDDTLFDEFLISAHWKHEVELLPGTGDYSIKDHYGNNYHNINFEDPKLKE